MNYKRIERLLLLLGICATGPVHARFPIIGYFASWDGTPADIQYTALTHVNYSFAGTDGAGNIGSIDEGMLWDLVGRGHQAGTKVGVAIGGYGADQTFIAMSSAPESRIRFVANAVALCDRFNLDGIDIDWEYPLPADADVFASLMTDLGAALHKKGRYLSVAVKNRDPFMKDPVVGPNFRSALFGAVDFINCMAYDYQGADHSPYDQAAKEIHYWTIERGCPRAKVTLGVPFYGKEMQGDGKLKATSYKDIIQSDDGASQRDVSGNIHYNGIPTLQKKAQLANDSAGGIMIWEVAQDTHGETSLLAAIAVKTAGYKDPPIAGVRGMKADYRILPINRGRIFSLEGSRVGSSSMVSGFYLIAPKNGNERAVGGIEIFKTYSGPH
jgi:chitinase